MTEEEKKPYIEMEKNNIKKIEFIDLESSNMNVNKNKTDPKNVLKDVLARFIQEDQESKATFIKGGPQSFHVFMKFKRKNDQKGMGSNDRRRKEAL